MPLAIDVSPSARTIWGTEDGGGVLRVRCLRGRRRHAAAIAAFVLLAFAGYALAGQATVNLGPAGPQPANLTVTWGDTVTFVNTDSVAHVVASGAAGFTSPQLNPGQSYEHVYNGATKSYGYEQQLGAGKFRGTVVVGITGTLTLSASRSKVAYGQSFLLSGISPLGESPVRIQARSTGAWTTVTDVTPSPDGRFSVPLKGSVAARLRAAAAADQLHSTEVKIQVTPALKVHASGRRVPAGRRLTVRATVAPANSATFATLERFNAKRFRWQTVSLRRLRSGSAVFSWAVPGGRSLLRVSITGRSTQGKFSPVQSKPFAVVGA
jgi:plastocyanin